VSALIEIADVSKVFIIRHNRSHSLKSRFIGTFHKRFRETREMLWALKNVSFSVVPGETMGLIGRNGSGKSTLLRIIAGIYRPTQGHVRLASGTKVGAMIELGVGFSSELTGRENIFLGASIHGLSRRAIDEIYPNVVDFSELDGFMDVPFKNYSSGMQARLGFALAVNLNPDVLLVDEILAVGDEAFQQKCIDKMQNLKAGGKTIVFVSHSAETIRKFCDRALVLDHGSLIFVGNPGKAIEEYHKLLAS
jgi:ABC-type polysaccharide/polyol phosphate transport system ATPase subunit